MLTQEWLWAHNRVRCNPATLFTKNFGTWAVDLYDRKSKWVYEVKMGRVGLPRASYQGFGLGKMIIAGLINGATMVSVENKGKSGFSKAAMEFLTDAHIKTLVINH